MTASMAERIDVDSDPVRLARTLADQGISDGLPVVPATPERVEAMFDEVTARYVAINSVLAGCSPEHMPVLLAVADALLDPALNLLGLQPTTNPVGPLVLVHGPIADRLGMNSGVGCFGPGNYANAVIGRAVRFMLQNLGGGLPGRTDHATHGWPGKYTFCAAEDAASTPWGPFHRRHGMATESAVSLFGVQGFHNVTDVTGRDGVEMLKLLARGMVSVGTNNNLQGGEAMLVLAPEQAAALARSGIDPDTAARMLFEHARIDLSNTPEPYQQLIGVRRPSWCDISRLPAVDRWEDIHLVVAGGPGVHAVYLPGFGHTSRLVVRPVHD
jgi:hypothetical protein